LAKYCVECGHALPSEAKFCNACGKRQDAKAMPAEPRASSANLGRPVLLKRLDDAIAHLSRKQQHYDYFDKLVAEKAARQSRSYAGSVFGFAILGLIVFVVLALFFEISGWPAFFVTVLGIGFIGGTWSNSANVKRLEVIEREITGTERGLRSHFSELRDCPVAFEYSNPRVVSEIRRLISAGRADTVKEAINCMIEDVHREKVLAQQQEIARQAKKAADAAGTASLFTAATFLSITSKRR
jgi:rRNA maturation endonuclease Nob1